MHTPDAVELHARTPRMHAADLAVDLGFGVLLVVCGLRYFTYHELAGTGILVLALALAAGASYAVALVRGPDNRGWQRAWLLTATAVWLPLVALAPSFGWSAFALFFAIHRVLSGARALALSATIVVAVSVGLYLMSNGTDLGLVLGPFFGGLVLAYAYWELDRSLATQKRLNLELLETRDKLAQTERVAGAAEERQRVASELHDTVAQRTAEALLRLEAERTAPQTSQASTEALTALRQALSETRSFMLGLVTPNTQQPVGLTEVLRNLADAAEATFERFGTERPIPDEASHALQRVTQEALANARKHAHASLTKVTLTYFADSVGVDIADNGAGFTVPEVPDTTPAPTPASPDSGFGIRAMHWRMRSLGGSLTVESAPGAGTTIAAVTPTTKGEQ
ncbi:signal transduction histidine kinase [Leucobacter komagatae]|uniref:Signal transduction histidine kinase n=1 Tax=Leucobacter komagatae TaxID=55969 RepID=A0A542Y8F4_9MICO|nr:sensor histidine kinase [Leucobacter komagatae]TQL44378.1 signal transduction histidine kinase [Leucobacter komagatae]